MQQRSLFPASDDPGRDVSPPGPSTFATFTLGFRTDFAEIKTSREQGPPKYPGLFIFPPFHRPRLRVPGSKDSSPRPLRYPTLLFRSFLTGHRFALLLKSASLLVRRKKPLDPFSMLGFPTDTADAESVSRGYMQAEQLTSSLDMHLYGDVLPGRRCRDFKAHRLADCGKLCPSLGSPLNMSCPAFAIDDASLQV